MAIICRDEGDRIEACLSSVPLASELLVLDSGSVDNTVEKARDMGARVVETDWPGFVEQRNRALAMATNPWVLFLDADERLSEPALRELDAFLSTESEAVAGSFSRCSRWQGAWIRHGRWYPDRKMRLIRGGLGQWVGDGAHERLETAGPCYRFTEDILHEPYRNFLEHLHAIDRYTTLQAEAIAKQSPKGTLVRMIAGPPAHFVKALVLEKGVLDGWRGVGLASLGALNVGLKWSRTRRLLP